ncbi:hypothetical protein [Nocardia sp. CA-120079]|uniref:hypothetical protein n=1 Tax=Nocardia sp. CA-120079 TaxID=3239974 RepID=UPI003D95349F
MRHRAITLQIIGVQAKLALVAGRTAGRALRARLGDHSAVGVTLALVNRTHRLRHADRWTRLDGVGRDDARGVMYTDIAETFDAVLSSAERGEVPWLDEVIAELASITTQAHDLVVLHAVGGIIAQRGNYSMADLAALTDADPAAVRRVLAELRARHFGIR